MHAMRLQLNLEQELHELQKLLAQTDLLYRSRGNGNSFGLMLVKKQALKIKIYQEVGHSMPHIHIDYGKVHHTASYSIETAQMIEGNLPRKYDRNVTNWIEKNKNKLLEVWGTLQEGNDHHIPLVAELKEDA